MSTLPTFYGHQVFETDDGEIIILGHPPLRRALAAANAFARQEWGHRLMWTPDVAHRWAAPDPDDADEYSWVEAGTVGAIPLTEVAA